MHGLVLEDFFDFFHSPADVDALALVQGRRLDQPHVFLAVLDRKLLFVAVATLDLAETGVELTVLQVLHQGRYYERGWNRVVDLVPRHHRCIVLQVEATQGTNETWLCGDLTVVFQVVVNHHSETFGKKLFHCVVGLFENYF